MRRRVLLALPLLAAGVVSAQQPAPPINWSADPVVVRSGDAPGYRQFQMSCAVCHGGGRGRPGTRALAARYKGAVPARLEQRRNLTCGEVRRAVRQGTSVMPPLRRTELSDADLGAICAYLSQGRR